MPGKECTCGKQDNTLPTNVHIPVPGAWEYAALGGNRGIAGGIKLRFQRWDIILDWPGGPMQSQGPYKQKGKVGLSESEKGM